MRQTTNLFLINGRPMLVPDGEVSVSYEDLDGAEAGRDEMGFMHRVMVRSKVPAWDFSYSYLTEQEKTYMESLFGDDATFAFTFPNRLFADTSETATCYRSKYGISWKNAKTGLWSGYSFRIIAC